MAEDGLELPPKEVLSLSGAEMLTGTYNNELKTALMGDMRINTEGRSKLRDIGINVKKVGYGLALSPLAIVGGFLGGFAGAGLGPIGAMAGRFLGRAAGAETAGLVYDHVIRRFDKDIDPLTKRDYLIGAFIGNPATVSGMIGVVEGVSTLRGEDFMKPILPTTIAR